MRRPIVAVIGDTDADGEKFAAAKRAGQLIAKKNWMLVTGGLGGVMEAASLGAAEANGTVIGILPQGSADFANRHVNVPIATNMGHARNVIIAHTADALIAVGGGMGTLSEIAIAGKLGKPVFAINSWDLSSATKAEDADAAIAECEKYLEKKGFISR